jgi:hypothetical protein
MCGCMKPPPFILVAVRQWLKVFSSEGGQRLRLINAIPIADTPESKRSRLSRDSFAKQAAGHMARLLQTHQPERWAFAAPPEVNGAILEGLAPKWLSTLQDNLPRDLHREAPGNLTKLFQRPLN